MSESIRLGLKNVVSLSRSSSCGMLQKQLPTDDLPSIWLLLERLERLVVAVDDNAEPT
jgi:hypothetical protein